MLILESVNEARTSRDNDDIRKALWYLKQVSPFAEDSSSIRSTATRVIANEVQKIEKNVVCNYGLKRSQKFKTLPTKTSIKLRSKDEAIFISDLLFHRLDFLEIGCNISLNDFKGHGFWVYHPALFESII